MNANVVEVLKRELAKRHASNQSYSLRAFARQLGVSPSNLSLVINGRRPVSRRMLERILTRLELRPLEREQILRAQLPVLENSTEDNIDLKTTERICHWVSYAILSLVLTKGFQTKTSWIARRLGVSIADVQQSLQALQTAGLLDTCGPKWKLTKGELRIQNSITTSITRQFQRQLIEKAVQGMDSLPMDERDVTSITFAMSPMQMRAAKEEIRKFRLRMSEIFEEKNVSQEVYNLTVQLVPATRSV